MGTDPDGNFFFALSYFIWVYQSITSIDTRPLPVGMERSSAPFPTFMFAQAASIIGAKYSFGSMLLERNIAINASEGLQSIFGDPKPDFRLDFGIGVHHFNETKWDWADLRDGDWLSDLNGWAAYTHDVHWFVMLDQSQRDEINEIIERYNPNNTYLEGYNESMGILDSELIDFGGVPILKDDYDKLIKIGEAFINGKSILDPISYLPFGIRKWWLKVLGIHGGGVHESGYRLPGGIAVTYDDDKNFRIHGNVDNNVGYGLGFIGHFLENETPIHFRKIIYELYQNRIYFY